MQNRFLDSEFCAGDNEELGGDKSLASSAQREGLKSALCMCLCPSV